ITTSTGIRCASSSVSGVSTVSARPTPASSSSISGRTWSWTNISTSNPASEIDKLDRSEQHTSELQSLIRYSYAVLCFKKKIDETRTITRLKYSHYFATH